MKITFTIPGPVVSWRRNRLSKQGEPIRDAKGKHYRSTVALCARCAKTPHNRALWGQEGPYRVEVAALYARPVARPRGVPVDVWREGGQILRPTKSGCDVDRLAGHILDGLGDAGVYGDDGQVCELVVRKFWAAKGVRPCAEVTVSAMGWLDVEDDAQSRAVGEQSPGDTRMRPESVTDASA